MPRRKRFLDLLVTSLALPVWLPVFVGCCLAVLLMEGRPIFYISTRRVHGRRSTRVVKFRAMFRDADRCVNRATVPVVAHSFLNMTLSDAAYTPVGRFLERCFFTELPQIFQVIRGDMSLVGNRPLPENVIDALRRNHLNVEERFLLPCGLTGPVQLVGRTRISDGDRLRMEGAYCRRCLTAYSMWLDLSILIHTVLVCMKLEPWFSVDRVVSWLDDRAQGAEAGPTPAPASTGPHLGGFEPALSLAPDGDGRVHPAVTVIISTSADLEGHS